MTEQLQEYLDFAVQMALDAGALTLTYFQQGIRPDAKADASPVTVADREAEQLIRSRIEARFPDHAIVGEEFGESGTDQRHRWIIDPIDGTRAFVRGVPLYGVLIGLEIDGEIKVGVAHFPALAETVSAAAGLGCRLNDKPAHVADTAQLKDALLAHYDVASFAKTGKEAAWQRLMQATQFRAGWADAYGYMLVATGRADIMIDAVINPWDGGPFPVILAEAGGYFGDWHGNSTIYGGEALATTAALLPHVLATINNKKGG